jgi:hypothetical protein
MPDKILLTMITPAQLRSPRMLGPVLDAFEATARTTPTHWGPDERARNPYDRSELLSEVGATQDDAVVPGIARRKTPRFDAYISLGLGKLNYAEVEFGASVSDADVKLAFTLGTALAASMKVEFGIVHPIWRLGERSQHYSASGIIRPRDFARCGPEALCARTWFGPQLAQLLDAKALRANGCAVRETSWGGLEVDLVEEPWTADFETLSARQTDVMTRLKSAGLFGDYSDGSQCKAGTRWSRIAVGATA